jgi:hypothetical protein
MTLETVPSAYGVPMNRKLSGCDKVVDIRRGKPPIMTKRVPKTWYVSIDVPRGEKTRHYCRRSQSFASEAEAKQFASEKIADGVDVSAGTLNPVAPKKIVLPSEIEDWLSEETNQPATGARKLV